MLYIWSYRFRFIKDECKGNAIISSKVKCLTYGSWQAHNLHLSFDPIRSLSFFTIMISILMAQYDTE